MAGTTGRVQAGRGAGTGSRNAAGRRQTAYGGRTTRGRQTAHGRGHSTEYIEGDVVRKLDIQRKMEAPPRKKVSNSTRKNRDKAFYMNFPYVAFLASALVIMGIVLSGYIQLQSDITQTVEHISKLESELNDLKLSNDEEYSRITSSIDLEEIRRIAIGELGMGYAKEGQVIGYQTDGSDYVRQYEDIPD